MMGVVIRVTTTTMAIHAHDVTSVFWPFISLVASLPYDVLKNTNAFNSFQKLADINPSFRIHLSAIDDIDESHLYDAIPLGTWADEEWMYFKDMNRLFWGLHELYQRQPPSERRTKITKALEAMQTISMANDISYAMETLSMKSTVDETISELISRMSLSF